MPKNTTQVIFECPEKFRRRLQQEKLKRGISLKRMIMKALEEYWESHYEGPAYLLTLEPTGPYDTPEKCHWADMIVKHMERCPAPKVTLLQQVIEADLKAHKIRPKGRKQQIPPARKRRSRISGISAKHRGQTKQRAR